MEDLIKDFIIEQKPQQPVTLKEKEQKETHTFTHSPYVLLINGEYKGVNAFIRDTVPSKYEIEFNNTEYIPNDNNNKIGDIIMSNYGEAIVRDVIPKMVSVITDEGQVINLPPSEFVCFVLFEFNGEKRVGIKRNEFNKANGYHNVSLLKILPSQDSENPFTEFFEIYEHSPITFDGMISENVIVTPDDVIKMKLYVARGQNKGSFGQFERYTNEQLKIEFVTRILVPQNWIGKIKGKSGTITKGFYKGKVATIVSKKPAVLTLELSSTGKIISEHLVYQRSTESYARKYITYSDVFHYDLKLVDNTDAEVKHISNDEYTCIVKNKNMFEEKIVNIKDVLYFGNGFKIEKTNNFVMDITDDISDMITDDTSDENNMSESVDEKEDTDNIDMEDLSNDLNKVSLDEKDELMDNLTTTFNHNMQIEVEDREIPEKDVSSIASIKRISNRLSLPVENVYAVLDIVKRVEENLPQVDKSNKFDQVFLHIMSIIYEFIKSGRFNYYNIDLSYTIVIEKLIGSNIIPNTADPLKDSIWMRSRIAEFDSGTVKHIQNLKQNKNYVQIFVIIMERCMQFIQKIEGYITISSNVVRQEPKPLYPTKITYISSGDLVDGSALPTHEPIIKWEPEHRDALKNYIAKLQAIIENPETKQNTRQVLEFITENLHRGPYTVYGMNNTPVNRAIKKMYEKAWGNVSKNMKSENVISSKKLISRSMLQDIEPKVNWSEDHKVILKEYISQIQDTIDNPDTPVDIKKAMEFTRDNLHRGSYTLISNKEQLDESTKDLYEKIWTKLVKTINSVSNTEKQSLTYSKRKNQDDDEESEKTLKYF